MTPKPNIQLFRMDNMIDPVLCYSTEGRKLHKLRMDRPRGLDPSKPNPMDTTLTSLKPSVELKVTM